MCLKLRVPFEFMTVGEAVLSGSAPCIACKTLAPAASLTVGARYANGEQAFACNKHGWDTASWLVTWTKFKAEQHLRPAKQPSNNSLRFYERRPMCGATEQAAEIARHMLLREGLGTTAIIVDRPPIFLSLVRKQWMKLSRAVQRQRASTLDRSLVQEFSRQAAAITAMRFWAKPLDTAPHYTDTFLVAPRDLRMLPAGCKNIYICSALDETATNALAHQWPPQAVIVQWCKHTE